MSSSIPPAHIKQRIASLRRLLTEDLHAANLDKLVQGCSALLGDVPQSLPLYVLKSIFKDFSECLDSGPVTLPNFNELTLQISTAADKVLAAMENGEPSMEHLKSFVELSLRNIALFRLS
jgi:hypothetical protein